MLQKLLKEVVTLIAGKQAEEIVELLDAKKHVNEFVIAKKLDLTINQTRNILYKISDYGLVSSIRKKDKRKGWYTYFWRIESLKSLEFLRDELVKKMNQMQSQIKSRETKRFYVCEKCHIELSEENALFHNFTCNECGSLLVMKDNTKLIKEMKRNFESMKRDLGLVEEEIRKEREKSDNIKMKEQKRAEKEKKKKSKKTRRINLELRKKAAKKAGKPLKNKKQNKITKKSKGRKQKKKSVKKSKGKVKKLKKPAKKSKKKRI